MRECVICGFSGIGKSTAEQKHRSIIDFESSGWSHSWHNGINIGKNPAFPQNYIDKLTELINKDEATFYLLSCHKEVREELKKRGIDYIIVMPTIDQKNEYLKRWLKRGSPIEFINVMNARWEDMIKSCEEDDAPKIYLSDGEYISDLICC
jgi:hypothetical protein